MAAETTKLNYFMEEIERLKEIAGGVSVGRGREVGSRAWADDGGCAVYWAMDVGTGGADWGGSTWWGRGVMFSVGRRILRGTGGWAVECVVVGLWCECCYGAFAIINHVLLAITADIHVHACWHCCIH